jgi:phage tail sheath gpL-like
MQVLQAFQVAARWHGFIPLNEADDGSAVWLRNVLPDVESSVHKRLCIDAITNSATLYWETAGAKVNSKTFRTVTGLREWLERHPARQQIPT